MNMTIVMPLADRHGGAEAVLESFVVRAVTADCRVVFLEDGPLVESLRELGVSASVIPAGRLREPHQLLGAIRRLARALRNERPDAVVAWMTKAHVYSGPAARLAGVPSLWIQHGMPDRRSPLDRVATLLPARGVIAVSQAVAVAQAALRPHRPTAVVYPGIDLERFDPGGLPSPVEARRRLGLPEGAQLVGIFARLQRWKGIHILIRAIRRCADQHPEIRCVVVGGVHELEPECLTELEREVTRLGIHDRVTFAGRQSDVPLWMQAMDVIVNASFGEPFGLTVLEAMAIGKPVVVPATGGPAEIVRDSRDGVAVQPGNPAALAAALDRLLEDPALRRRLGDSGRVRVRDFRAERFAERLTSTVRELIS